jgi:hypothetical protein
LGGELLGGNETGFSRVKIPKTSIATESFPPVANGYSYLKKHVFVSFHWFNGWGLADLLHDQGTVADGLVPHRTHYGGGVGGKIVNPFIAPTEDKAGFPAGVSGEFAGDGVSFI